MAGKGPGAVEAKKRGPEFMIKLAPAPTRLRRDTAFIANIRFKNDLPEIPCDPKMLLPPLNAQELAAFSLTSLERETKRDMLLEPDLGLPISMLDIGRYTVPYETEADKPPLDPKDAALLEDEDAGMSSQRARLRGSDAELSWLLRTKYITNEGAEQAKRAAAREAAARRAAEEALLAEGQEGAIAAIERSFEAAQQVPVHPTNPALEPVEILPVFPDDMLEGRTYVLALFDNDPAADLGRLLEALPPQERHRITQAAQLKSFAQQRADGRVDRFVAYLVPRRLRPVGEEQQREAEATGSIPAEALQADYEWVREYDQAVKYDAKDATFLFRFAPDHVGYHDLNTRLLLRKRKRQQYERGGGGLGGEEEQEFVPPEKVVLRLPGNADLEDIEEEDGGAGAAAGGSPRAQQQQQPKQHVGESPELGGSGGLEEEEEGGGGGGSPVVQQQQDLIRDVFGDDDDDL